jgi:UDP-N-acetylglucosamine transferase subunit ALG13
MIFATVGTQLNFDRMLRIIDDWAEQGQAEVFCQVGPSELNFSNCEHKKFINPIEYEELMQKCDVLVAHAGIGSILSAMKYRKPIIIFPRKASLGEHRNEHQLATAKQFQKKNGIYVAYSDKELIELLESHKELSSGGEISEFADNELISSIKSFIHS